MAWDSPEKVMDQALQKAHGRVIESERRILYLLEEKKAFEIALDEAIRFFIIHSSHVHHTEFRQRARQGSVTAAHIRKAAALYANLTERTTTTFSVIFELTFLLKEIESLYPYPPVYIGKKLWHCASCTRNEV